MTDILRIGTILISPVIPNKANEVFQYLNISRSFDISLGKLEVGNLVNKPQNLFPKIDNL